MIIYESFCLCCVSKCLLNTKAPCLKHRPSNISESWVGWGGGWAQSPHKPIYSVEDKDSKNFPPPVSFNLSSCPIFLIPPLCSISIAKCYAMLHNFFLFFHFLPAWESCISPTTLFTRFLYTAYPLFSWVPASPAVPSPLSPTL